MGQVSTQVSYLVIGGGRVASHWGCYFEQIGLPFHTWNRSQSRTELADLARQSTHALLLISDPAIGPFAEEHRAELGDLPLIHFSASYSNPGIHGAHPLMTFADELYDLATYESIPFVLESESPLSFQELLPGLANPSYRISREQKSRYHALCVMSGNFTTLLWEHAFREFSQKMDLPKEVLLPFLQRTALNLVQSGPGESVLTGPLARADSATIAQHLQALGDDPYREVYEAFVRAHQYENR